MDYTKDTEITRLLETHDNIYTAALEEYNSLKKIEQKKCKVYIAKYWEELDKLETFIRENNFYRPPRKNILFNAKIIMALKMYLLDAPPKLLKSYFKNLLAEQIKIIAIFWFKCDNFSLTRPKYIQYIVDNYYAYDPIPTYCLRYLCLELRDYRYTLINKDLAHLYINEYYHLIPIPVQKRMIDVSGNLNTILLKRSEWSIEEEDKLVEIQILNYILKIIRN